MSTVEIAIEHDLGALRDAWRHLAAETDNIFATWEWATVWWRHFGRGQPMVATVRIDGEVRAIIPLYAWRTRPLRIVRFIGHGPADRLGPICAGADRPVMAAARRRILADIGPWDIVLADVLPPTAGWSEGGEGVRLATESSPLMGLAGLSWSAYLAHRGHHFRAHLRRRERKLDAAGRVHIRSTTNVETLPDDLDALFRLHRARHGTATQFSRLESFHREFAAVAMQNGWLRLWILELDDDPVAAWYGFRFGSAYLNYQGGRDPMLARLEVGTVLIVHTIQQAIDEGADTYHFLRGGEEYKYHFAEQDEELATVGLSHTLAGRLSLRSYHLARRMAIRLRRRGAPGVA